MRLVGTFPHRISSPFKYHVRQFASSDGTAIRKTALYDIHVKEGGNMVEYGGFQMPIYYKSQSISDSVNWTRSKASLFDVRSPLEERDVNCRWVICNSTGFWCQDFAC